MKIRYSKYKAMPTIIDGIRFASKKEANRYAELKLLEKAGKISLLSRQRKHPLEVAGKIIGYYVSDFSYTDEDEVYVVEDAKGMRLPLYLWKKKHFEAQYGIKIKET